MSRLFGGNSLADCREFSRSFSVFLVYYKQSGARAFAISAEPAKKKDNPLRTAEMTVEDDYGMIDGVINNGSHGEEVEKVKPSIRERLEDAKRECADHKPPEKRWPGRSTPEHDDL